MKRKKRKKTILPGALSLLSAVFLLLYASAGGRETLQVNQPVPEGALPEDDFALASESALLPEDERVGVGERTVTVAAGAKGYLTAGQALIKNNSDKVIDAAALASAAYVPPRKGEGAQVLLVHTHGSEAYIDSAGVSGNDRTLDVTQNMIRVGDEVAKVLEQEGVETVHIREIFDYPSYNGSYANSCAAIEQQLKEHPSIRVVVDLHRDAVIGQDGTRYKMVATVDGQKMAQLMLVMGTGSASASHPQWEKNLSFASVLQNRLSANYPQLMRPILVRSSRYNQQLTTGSILLEVGSSGNTLGEAIASAQLFAKELAACLTEK